MSNEPRNETEARMGRGAFRIEKDKLVWPNGQETMAMTAELAFWAEIALLRNKLIGSDRLADEVDVLVHRKVIDSRSPAADALLDFREPPSTPRSCRLADLEKVSGGDAAFLKKILEGSAPLLDRIADLQAEVTRHKEAAEAALRTADRLVTENKRLKASLDDVRKRDDERRGV